MSEKNREDTIDVGRIIRKVWAHKRVFFITWPITFVVASLLILCVPRGYTSESMLAPESSSSALSGAGMLSSLASSVGFDLSQMQGEDAISPLLYPDLMEDNGFVAGLLEIRVRSYDGAIDTTYQRYLERYQKKAWWTAAGNWIKKLLPKPKEKFTSGGGTGKKDPYVLTKKEDGIMEKARKNITFSVDKKTGVISVKTKSQDPFISKTLADSVTVKLQNFITDYRTNKARIDLEYYRKLTAEAKEQYDEACREYSHFSDANNDLMLQVYKSQQDDLENEMQLAYNTYSMLNTQLQAAMAKVQEDTPAFTKLKGAQVAVKASSPKRMLFVLGMLILVSICDVFYILRGDIRNSLLK